MSAKRRTLTAALLAAALLAPATSVAEGKKAHKAPVAAAAVKQCADADLEPAAGNLRRIRKAILCLHNHVRAEHGLPALRANKRLRTAATRHSRDMVRHAYFDHTTPSGVTMVDRILKARYVRADEGWALGENIAWGTGSYATPRHTMEAWMNSPGHRANILRGSYRDLGIGVVRGVPVSETGGATYTVDFGVRR